MSSRKTLDAQMYTVQLIMEQPHRNKRVYVARWNIPDHEVGEGLQSQMEDVLLNEIDAERLYRSEAQRLVREGHPEAERLLLVRHSRWAPYPGIAVLLSTLIPKNN